MIAIDAGIDHRPDDLAGVDGEERARRVGLDGRDRPRDCRERAPVERETVQTSGSFGFGPRVGPEDARQCVGDVLPVGVAEQAVNSPGRRL